MTHWRDATHTGGMPPTRVGCHPHRWDVTHSGGMSPTPVGCHVTLRSQRWPEGFVTPQDWLCHRGDMKQPVCSCHTFRVSGVTGSAESNAGQSRNRPRSEPAGSSDVTTALSHRGHSPGQSSPSSLCPHGIPAARGQAMHKHALCKS